MLSLEQPPLSVGGLTVFADHADGGQFYYAAPHPRLARSGGQPMLDLFTYAVELTSSPLAGTRIPDELGAGFLTMGVDCALAEGARGSALQALATRLGRDPGQIALSPIPYLRGTVSVIALDAASGAAAASMPAVVGDRPRFVEAVVGTGAPSLIGDLRSIFSLSLSQEGVTFLEGLYADAAAPVGVVYNLTFLGLRPSVQAHVHADVSKIYTELGGKASVGCAYVRAEVEGLLTTLEQRGVVTVELTTQAVGPEATAAKELALSLFKDRIIQELFNPAPQLPNIAMPTIPGAGQTSIVTLSLKAKRDEELRTVDYDFSERSPEERTHAPQAFIASLLSAEEMAARIHHVDLASDFFELLEVLVSGPSAEEFAALGLRSVTIDLRYGGEEAGSGIPADAGSGIPADADSLVFRPGSPSDLTWAVRRKGRHTLGYTAAVTYEFNREGSVDADALTYRIPPRPETGRTLSVRPYDDLAILDVEVDLGRLDPGVRDVDVTLAYDDPATGFTAQHQLRLSPATPLPLEQRRWQVRTTTAGTRAYTAHSVLTFTDGAVFALPPVTTSEHLARIDAPFRASRSLLVQPNVTSDDVTSMTVEVRYDDAAAGYARRFTQVLTPSPALAPAPADPTVPASAAGQTPAPTPPAASPGSRWAPVTLSWPILDAARQEIQYRVTTAAGGVIDAGEWTPT
ncbi:MAG TPA: hypothetical protein VHM65_03715, partial [Candidatus Lustribacter sp.]|nr:hypothetical protein [Candidatus Lustribacter sp.]